MKQTRTGWSPWMLGALAAAAGCAAHAQFIYKSIDAGGRVIYSQEPVPGAIRVDKIDISPPVVIDKAAVDHKRQDTQRLDQEFRQRQAARDAAFEKARAMVVEAEKRLAAARLALEKGQEPLPGERQAVVGGRTRPTEAYLERIKRLEMEVEAAKKQLEEAQRQMREVR